jgi:hypothetical protein
MQARTFWSAMTAIAALLSAAAIHAASAQDSFYKSKTVTIVVGYPAAAMISMRD